MDSRIAFRCKPAQYLRPGDTLCFSNGSRLIRAHVTANDLFVHITGHYRSKITLATDDVHEFPPYALVAYQAVEVEVGRDMDNLTDL